MPAIKGAQENAWEAPLDCGFGKAVNRHRRNHSVKVTMELAKPIINAARAQEIAGQHRKDQTNMLAPRTAGDLDVFGNPLGIFSSTIKLKYSTSTP